MLIIPFFCEKGDNNTTKDQVNKDEISTDANSLEAQDQPYPMLTTSKEIKESQQRPGNISLLLSKAYSKTWFLGPSTCE